MSLKEHQVAFIVVMGVMALIAASPALSKVLVLQRTEFFSEFWLLGPRHTAEDYPFNVSRNQDYRVFLGIKNQLGQCAYYSVAVKFYNRSMLGPDIYTRTPSSAPTLFNIAAFVADEDVWEMPLTFSFDYDQNETLTTVEFNSLELNNVELNVTGYTAAWDREGNGFIGYFFFELWIYDRAVDSFQYHERFVGLRLNMTTPSQ